MSFEYDRRVIDAKIIKIEVANKAKNTRKVLLDWDGDEVQMNCFPPVFAELGLKRGWQGQLAIYRRSDYAVGKHEKSSWLIDSMKYQVATDPDDWGHWNLLNPELSDRDHHGFIYYLEHKDGRKYIGKKMFAAKTSPWKTYTGSGEFKMMDPESFVRKDILYTCETKGQLGVYECRELFMADALFDSNFVNGQVEYTSRGTHLGKDFDFERHELIKKANR